MLPFYVVIIVQLLGCVWSFVNPWIVACQAPLSSTISQSLLKFMSIESVMPSNHLILSCPLLLLPSIFPSIKINETALHIREPKYWSFSFSICPSNEYSAWISFRMDWLDLLIAQGTLKSLLQHHNSKAFILQWAAISSSRGSSWPRDQTGVSCVSCTGRQILYLWASWEAP